jgi:hypothetical protein
MEILGIDLSVIPTFKIIMVVIILIFACVITGLSLISSEPHVKFFKRALLIFSLLGIIYLNIQSHSAIPYVFLIAEIVVLILCYTMYLNVLTRLVNMRADIDAASRYLNDIKRKRELRSQP